MGEPKLKIYPFWIPIAWIGIVLVYWIVNDAPIPLLEIKTWTERLWAKWDVIDCCFYLSLIISFGALLLWPQKNRDIASRCLSWFIVHFLEVSVAIFLLIIAYKIIIRYNEYLVTGLLPHMDKMDRAKIKIEVWKLIAQSLGGIAIFIGVILTYMRTRAAEGQAIAAQKQVTAMEDGQITERYTAAIKQLGDGNASIHLGGIYALERIALDSLKREPAITPQDWLMVVRVILTLLKETTEQGIENHIKKTNQDALDFIGSDQIGDISYDKNVPALLSVLGSLYRANHKKYPIDLKHINLINVRFQGIDLSLLDLNHAKFRGSTFNDAILDYANLTWTDFRNARLQGASLLNATLTYADLRKAEMADCILNNADLTEAQLDESRLEGAWLNGSILPEAKLRKARLDGAHLENATLKGARLGHAILRGADLRDADFQDANLIQTNLQEVKNLTIEQLCQAKTLYRAVLDYGMQELVKKHCLEKWRDPLKKNVNEDEDK